MNSLTDTSLQVDRVLVSVNGSSHGEQVGIFRPYGAGWIYGWDFPGAYAARLLILPPLRGGFGVENAPDSRRSNP